MREVNEFLKSEEPSELSASAYAIFNFEYLEICVYLVSNKKRNYLYWARQEPQKSNWRRPSQTICRMHSLTKLVI